MVPVSILKSPVASSLACSSVTRQNISTEPPIISITIESGFAITLRVTSLMWAFSPQYPSKASSTTDSCGVCETNLYGPVPTTFVSGSVFHAGMIAVVMYERKSGSGSLILITTFPSSFACRKLMLVSAVLTASSLLVSAHLESE